MQRAITNYFIYTSVQNLPHVKASIRGEIVFSSFLKAIHHSQSLLSSDESLRSTLTAWNFDRVVVNGDGNCFFTSVAISLIAHIQAGHVNGRLTLARVGLQDCDFMDPVVVSRALRTAVVDEWLGENSDNYQGFTTVDIRSHAERYRVNGEFAGELGDLMGIANILRIPLLIFTNIQNMLVIVTTPSLCVPETPVPLHLVYNSTGPGHYDYAVAKESPPCETKEMLLSCGRKSNFKGVLCSTDTHGNCRCVCARAKLACGELCRCRCCENVNGQRPTPSQTRRSYDNQRVQLRGVSGAEYMTSLNEDISTGSMSLLEIMVIQMIIMCSILNGVECTSEAVHRAYSDVFLQFTFTKLIIAHLPR